jgi:molybdate transport system substrate-binding protein
MRTWFSRDADGPFRSPGHHATHAARISTGWMVLLASSAVLMLLTLLLTGGPKLRRAPGAAPLVVYCAAGLRAPIEAIAKQFEKECGVPIQLQYGGSQTLLANLTVSRVGDLYLPADEDYIRMGRERGLVAETIPLATMRAVLATRKDQPKQLTSLDDLVRNQARLAQAEPDAAAVGRVVRATLRDLGQWDAIVHLTAVSKPTVNDVLNDIKLGSVDAGFIWDALARQNPDLIFHDVFPMDKATARVLAGVLRSSRQPTAALRFARYLGARDRGLEMLASHHFTVAEGDAWAVTPEIVFYSGAMNRVAVEETVREFEQREGARISLVYNGCGILVGQMKAGGRPDAYLTCDASFLPPVADLFQKHYEEVSESEIVMLVPKGNPRGIKTLADLAQAGLRMGVANPEQSTLGALTRRLLESQSILGPVMSNVVAQTPTADMLVNQIRTGALDATVVYISNTMKVREHLDVIPLKLPGSIAVQTYSVARNTRYPQLAARLAAAILSDSSRQRYLDAGFRWRGTNR